MTWQGARPPAISLLTSHWVGMLGVALATTAGFSWLFVLPMQVRDENTNPYIGLLVVFAIPLLLLAGLALIPLGMALARRRDVRGTRGPATSGRAAWRKLGIFVGLMSFVNVVIGSQATYRSVQYMDTKNFCGATCHVMKPEFTAAPHAAHAGVACVDCHVAPGAQGYVKAKMAGTQQLIHVIFNSYRRPIDSGIASGKLAKSADTCGNCHSGVGEQAADVRIRQGFQSDAANTPTSTVLVMMAGAIHGAHMRKGVTIRFGAEDAARQRIPRVEVTDARGQVTVYSGGAGTAKLPMVEMQCVDCHNRPAHSFELPERAVDRAMADGRLPRKLPWLRQQAVAALKVATSSEVSGRFRALYTQNYPAVYESRGSDIAKAGAALAQIHEQNVFPDLKVTWGTYPTNLGHMDTPGCFRCHDGDHMTRDKRAITNDCATCHQLPAVDDPSPAVLKSLGLAN